MKTLFKSLLIIFSALLLSSGVAMAEKSHSLKVGEKLGAGIANIATGVVEIPKDYICQWQREWYVLWRNGRIYHRNHAYPRPYACWYL